MKQEFSAAIQPAYDLWNSLRADRPYPKFSDLEPETLGKLAEHAILLTVLANDDDQEPDFLFLAVGSHLAERFGPGLYRSRVSQLDDLVLRKTLLTRYRKVIASGEPVYGKGDRELDKLPYSYEALTMPLGNAETGQVTHLLGVAIYYTLQQYRALFGKDRVGENETLAPQ